MISVVIPHITKKKTLKRVVSSAKKYSDEIIVVDDPRLGGVIKSNMKILIEVLPRILPKIVCLL